MAVSSRRTTKALSGSHGITSAFSLGSIWGMPLSCSQGQVSPLCHTIINHTIASEQIIVGIFIPSADFIVLFPLSLSYFPTFIPLWCSALDVAMPLIVEDDTIGIKSTEIGGMLTVCSFFYLVGKLCTGFTVDNFGGRFVFLWVASFAASLLTGLFGLAYDIHRMKILWCGVCLAQATGMSMHRLLPPTM